MSAVRRSQLGKGWWIAMDVNDAIIDWEAPQGSVKDWKLALEDDFLPDILTADEVSYTPPEHGCQRLEIRDPVTQGRHAWGYLSEDETFIMNDNGDVYIKWNNATTTISRDTSQEKWVSKKGVANETFEEQQDRIFLMISSFKFARVNPKLGNRLERWIHASRLGHWLRAR